MSQIVVTLLKQKDFNRRVEHFGSERRLEFFTNEDMTAEVSKYEEFTEHFVVSNCQFICGRNLPSIQCRLRAWGLKEPLKCGLERVGSLCEVSRATR